MMMGIGIPRSQSRIGPIFAFLPVREFLSVTGQLSYSSVWLHFIVGRVSLLCAHAA